MPLKKYVSNGVRRLRVEGIGVAEGPLLRFYPEILNPKPLRGVQGAWAKESSTLFPES